MEIYRLRGVVIRASALEVHVQSFILSKTNKTEQKYTQVAKSKSSCSGVAKWESEGKRPREQLQETHF